MKSGQDCVLGDSGAIGAVDVDLERLESMKLWEVDEDEERVRRCAGELRGEDRSVV